MLSSVPLPLHSADAARRAAPTSPRGTTAPGAWRYHAPRTSRGLVAVAVLASATIHALILFGIPRRHPTVAPKKTEELILLTITMPKIEELEPERVPDDPGEIKPDTGLPAPQQADVPQIANPNDFVQQVDFASLVERPDMTNAKVFAIPEHISHGKIGEGMGNIFNLADLDRVPEPLFQPAPVYPQSLRREGLVATVHVEFIVDIEGRVISPFAVDTDNHAFDDAAVLGVAKWKFRAGMKGGRKVNTRMRVPIVFKVMSGDIE